jgi:hypothetical protein
VKDRLAQEKKRLKGRLCLRRRSGRNERMLGVKGWRAREQRRRDR